MFSHLVDDLSHCWHQGLLLCILYFLLIEVVKYLSLCSFLLNFYCDCVRFDCEVMIQQQFDLWPDYVKCDQELKMPYLLLMMLGFKETVLMVNLSIENVG